MTTRILLSLIIAVAILVTCLEGRYHLDATGLRHHRHDRHHEDWDRDQLATGFRRRDWEEDSDDRGTTINHHHKDRTAVSNGRRTSDRTYNLAHDRWGSGGAARRARYEPQRRWWARYEGRHLRHDYYHRGSGPSRRHPSEEGGKDHREASWHTSGSSRPWTYRKPAGYGRHRDDDLKDYEKTEERRRGWYDDEDDGYEADDEEYYPPRKAGNPQEGHFKGRRNRHESNNWHDDWKRRFADDEEEEYDDTDDYDPDDEDYEVHEAEKRTSRRKHGKRLDDFDDYAVDKRKPGPGHSAQNNVAGRRGGRKRDGHFGDEKRTRERPADLNEVEEDAELEDEVEMDEDDGDLDEYDETESSYDLLDTKEESSWKAFDDIIRKLTATDQTTTTTPKSTARRDYRNVENDRHPDRDRYDNLHEAKETLKTQPHRTTHKKARDPWGPAWGATASTTTTTTKKPESYAKYVSELDGVTNSSRNEIGAVQINEKITKVNNGAAMDVKNPLASQLTKTESDMKTKSLEQDYEEYGNDGSDDRAEDMDEADAETEIDEKWPSEKDQDYSEEENTEDSEDETEKPLSMTTLDLPLTTTTTTTPSPISTRSLDHRQSRTLDTRSGLNRLRYPQTNPSQYPAMSNYSAHKWRTLGSRKAVNEHRNSGKIDDNLEIRRAATDHVRTMREQTACQWPRPKVISVHDVHPNHSKTYRPACTILHRCADDTGCCKLEGNCVPKQSRSVELSFYVTSVDDVTSVEKLKFENHTECHCRPRPPPPPPPRIVKQCKCPSNFTRKVTPGHECQCHCLDHRMDCIRQRRGKEYFNLGDQWCIRTGLCTMPSCEFGEYKAQHGRCTQKMERLSTTRYESESNTRYRN